MRTKLFSFIPVLLAAATLTACGGGGDASDPADKYVGVWKSKCYSYVAINGLTRYTSVTRTINKANASRFTMTAPNSDAYADAACTVVVATAVNDYLPVTVDLGESVIFGGLPAEKIVYTNVSGSRPGYAAISGNNFYAVTYDPAVGPSGNWSAASPYTRQ